jgi:hypothetical protein
VDDTERMLEDKCSLEAFQERMLSSEFDATRLSVSSTQIRAAVHQLSVDAAASASASRV